jgi:predicted MPP superfamily phosphohydrolase
MIHRRVVTAPYLEGPLRVVHVTDTHFAPSLPWNYYRSIAERINEESPDLILMTGDFVSKIDYVPLLEKWLSLPLQARLGKYAVLGNHDYWAKATSPVREALEQAGVRVLSGRCVNAHRHVVLCGTEWPWGEDFSGPALTDGEFVVALSHTPDNVYGLSGRAHAVFSGHYHGGQWRVPGIGSLIVPSVFGRRFDQGHFTVAGTDLFVSAGLGADYPPIRIFCPPELLVVDFVSRDVHRSIAMRQTFAAPTQE